MSKIEKYNKSQQKAHSSLKVGNPHMPGGQPHPDQTNADSLESNHNGTPERLNGKAKTISRQTSQGQTNSGDLKLNKPHLSEGLGAKTQMKSELVTYKDQSSIDSKTVHNPHKPEEPTDTQTKDSQKSGNPASAGSPGTFSMSNR